MTRGGCLTFSYGLACAPFAHCAPHQLSLPASNGEFITAATYSTAHNLMYVTAPTDVPDDTGAGGLAAIRHGLLAMAVNDQCRLTLGMLPTRAGGCLCMDGWCQCVCGPGDRERVINAYLIQ